MQLCSSLSILWHCLSLGLEWKLTFSSPVATAEFSKFFWHIQCSTFTASSFRIWNSSAGIASPPLALFILMLPRTYLTSHSRMSTEEVNRLEFQESVVVWIPKQSACIISFCSREISFCSIFRTTDWMKSIHIMKVICLISSLKKKIPSHKHIE